MNHHCAACLLLILAVAVTHPSSAQRAMPEGRSTAERKVLFEEFTGEWCSLCPGGTIDMDKALRMFAGKVVPVSYHDNDPLEIRELNAMLDSIPFDPLYPGGTFDRLPYAINNPKHKMSVDRYDFQSTLAKAALRPSHASITAAVTIDRSARTLTVEARAEFLAPDTGDFRIQCIVTESGIRRDNLQRNAYDKDPSSYPQLFGAGDPLRTWTHDHVARALLGGPAGSAGVIPSMPTIGQGYTALYTYTVPAQIDIDRLGVVVFVTNYERGSITGNEVLNAEGYLHSVITDAAAAPAAQAFDLQLYPNPCAGIAWLRSGSRAETPRVVEVRDMMGRRMDAIRRQEYSHGLQIDLRALPSGLYHVSIRTGTAVTTRLLMRQ